MYIDVGQKIIILEFNMKRPNDGNEGQLSLSKSAGLGGYYFFGISFYCIFGRFGKMTHLVDLKKCRGSSPGCPGLCAAPAK